MIDVVGVNIRSRDYAALINAYRESPLEGTRTGTGGIKRRDEAAALVAHEAMIDVVGVNIISSNRTECVHARQVSTLIDTCAAPGASKVMNVPAVFGLIPAVLVICPETRRRDPSRAPRLLKRKDASSPKISPSVAVAARPAMNPTRTEPRHPGTLGPAPRNFNWLDVGRWTPARGVFADV